MFASYDLLQRYQFSAKEVLRSLLKSATEAFRIWYYPGHLTVGDERHLYIFDVLTRDDNVHGHVDPLCLSVPEGTPLDFVYWKAMDTYIAVFTNGSVRACHFDSAAKRWAISTEGNIAGHQPDVTLMSLSLLPDVNSLVWCQKERLASSPTTIRYSVRRARIHVQAVEGSAGELLSMTLVCDTPIVCVDDCPPCDLHHSTDCLVVWPRVTNPTGVFLTLSPMLTTVTACSMVGSDSCGAPVKQDLLTRPASYVDLVARSAWLWMQIPESELLTVVHLCMAADTQVLYAVTAEGHVYNFAGKMAAMSSCRVTLPQWALGALGDARITNGCMLIPWNGTISTFDLTTGVSSSFSLNSGVITPIGRVCSWQSTGDLPMLGFCNTDSIYLVQSTAEPPLTLGVSNAALKSLLHKSAAVYKDNGDVDVARLAYENLLSSGLSRVASALQSPALLIAFLHRAKANFQEQYVRLLVQVRSLMLSQQSKVVLTELEELLDPHVREFWSLETAVPNRQIGSVSLICSGEVLPSDSRTLMSFKIKKKVQAFLQDMPQSSIDNLCQDRSLWQQLSVMYPETMLDAILGCLNLTPACGGQSTATSTSKCLHYKQIWSPISLAECSKELSSRQWHRRWQPAVLTIIARLVYVNEPHLLICVWSLLKGCCNDSTGCLPADSTAASKLLAASLPDPSCSRRPGDAAKAKAAVLLLGSATRSIECSSTAAALALLLQCNAVDEMILVLESLSGVLSTDDAVASADRSTPSTRALYWKYVVALLKKAIQMKVLGMHGRRLLGLLPSSFRVPDFLNILKTGCSLPSVEREPLVTAESSYLCIADIRQFAVMLQRRDR